MNRVTMPKSPLWVFPVVALLLPVLMSGCASTSNSVTGGDGLADYSLEINEEYGIDKSVQEIFNRSIVLLKEEKYREAIDLLVKVTKETDKHSAPYINLGIAYVKVDKIEEAEQVLLKAQKINPSHPVMNNELAIVYRKTGRFVEARKAYERALEAYPQFLPARKNLGILCDLYMNDTDCALKNYENYLAAIPTEKDVKIWVADLKQRAGR